MKRRYCLAYFHPKFAEQRGTLRNTDVPHHLQLNSSVFLLFCMLITYFILNKIICFSCAELRNIFIPFPIRKNKIFIRNRIFYFFYYIYSVFLFRVFRSSAPNFLIYQNNRFTYLCSGYPNIYIRFRAEQVRNMFRATADPGRFPRHPWAFSVQRTLYGHHSPACSV